MEHLLSQDRGEPGNTIYDYAEPHRGDDDLPEAALIKALAMTAAFQRLADIRFLGALDYCLIARPNGAQSNARFTRAQHSMGVAALARAYLKIKDRTSKESLICVAAAMLHDIGHPPFSHTLEPVFSDRFGIDHHSASAAIIRGDSIFGNEITDVLDRFKVSYVDVLEVLDSDNDNFDGFFSGPVNFDTIEGILRSRNYLKMQNLGITPLKVVEAATQRRSVQEEEVVDNFWNCKDEMYNLVIRSRRGVFFDMLFQELARDIGGDISESDFFLGETQFFRKFPDFRSATRQEKWVEMANALLPDEMPYQVRHFYIDHNVSFFGRQDSARYRQTKTDGKLTLQGVFAS